MRRNNEINAMCLWLYWKHKIANDFKFNVFSNLIDMWLKRGGRIIPTQVHDYLDKKYNISKLINSEGKIIKIW
jgi:hypothetical protein